MEHNEQSNHPTEQPAEPAQPSVVPETPSYGEPSYQAAPQKRRRKWVALVIAVVAIIIIAGAAFAVLHAVAPKHTKVASSSTTQSQAPASGQTVQTSDLGSDLSSANQSASQENSDAQSADNGINDSNSQVAVPTE